MRFGLLAMAWSVALFGVLRQPWVERTLVLPLAALQGGIAAWYGPGGPVPLTVSVQCSGADVLALFLGVLLAYPASWRWRGAGLALGTGLILGLNTVRIGTLARAATSPALFAALHLYVWPALLVLATGAYTVLWMHGARRQPFADTRGAPPAGPLLGRARRFAALALGLLGLFAAAAPWVAQAPALLALAAGMARAAGALLHVLGIPAVVSGNGIWTTRGAFLVTPDCVATPLVPVYVAGAFTLPRTWRGRGLALALTAPLFLGLGVVRTALVALPPALVASPLFVVHAFYQLVAGALVVAVAAGWRDGRGPTGGRRRLTGRVLAAVAVGLVVGMAAGGAYTRLVERAAGALASVASMPVPRLTGPEDTQGALRLFPAYQAGLLAALGLARRPALPWGRLAASFGLLAGSQVAFLSVLGLLATGAGAPPPLLVRAWAVAGPVLMVLSVSVRSRPWRRGGRPRTIPGPLPPCGSQAAAASSVLDPASGVPT
jgi:exosortase/archaeosortase family protein